MRLHRPGDQLWLDAGVRIVDGQDRVAKQRFEESTAGYEIVDVVAGVRIHGALELSVGVRNLTDELYADHLNSLHPFTGERVPAPGRSLFVEFSHAF